MLRLAELVRANPASRRGRLHDTCSVGNDFGLRVLWERNPMSVAWYSWIQQMPGTAKSSLTGPVDVRQPLKK